MSAPNRRQRLLDGGVGAVGIDFVELDPTTQTQLWIYFIGEPSQVFLPWPSLDLTDPAQIDITSLSPAADPARVSVLSANWESRNARDVLHLVVAAPGDFSRYAMTLLDAQVPPRIDPWFNGVPFRFQAACPSDLDCQPPPPACAPITEPEVTVDYLARDFDSYRQALLAFASQRWPDWTDRLEADLAVTLMELLCAQADEMAWQQDRIAREAGLGASQRRSLRHHARLTDVEARDGLAAWTWLRIDPTGGTDLNVPWGTAVRSVAPREPGTDRPLGPVVSFEVGRGLADTLPDATPRPEPVVRSAWNAIPAWLWDEDSTCLPAGSTAVWVEGALTSGLQPLWSMGADRWVLLQSRSLDPDMPQRRHVVKLTGAREAWDPVQSAWATELQWDATQATPFDMALQASDDGGPPQTVLTVHANLVPAVAGRTVPAPGADPLWFSIGEAVGSYTTPVRRAIERLGPDGSASFLLPLDETEHNALAFVGESVDGAAAEVRLDAFDGEGDLDPTRWPWQRSLTGSPAANASDAVFTLEDGLWGEVARWWRGHAVVHEDYRSGAGFTARFGDGAIGAIPDPGTVFRLVYRVCGGARDNVAADTLVETDLAGVSVSNPLPVSSGVDAESADALRLRAAEAWKAGALRAVRPEDYAQALQALPWVQSAGAQLRWTGSWLTVFATPDPRDAAVLGAEHRAQAQAQLTRVRQAGREAHVLDPVYAWIDLQVELCIEASAYRGAVKAAVLDALFAPGRGFFDPDAFRFGDPLRRSALQACLQSVPGVQAVEGIELRRRGHFDWRAFEEEALVVGRNELVGLANDPLWPERGTVRLVMQGGA